MNEYPTIAQILSDLDMEVLTDIGELAGGEILPVYAIGTPEDLAAGLRRSFITPWFASLQELSEYVEQHHASVQKLVDLDISDIPDGFIHEWDK